MNRGAAVAAVIAIVLLTSSIGGIALAADSASAAPSVQTNSTETPTPTDTETADDWEPPGPFSLEELKANGEHPNGAPASVREFGEPAQGQIGLQSQSLLTFGSSEYEWVESQQTVDSDTIRVYAPIYDKEYIGNFTAVIVYWQPAERQVGNTTEKYAANQTVQRVGLNFERGANLPLIELYSHYDTEKQVTFWLEHEGDVVEGARWRFTHRSNPLSAAPMININSTGDALLYALLVLGLGAIIGIPTGRRAAKDILDEIILGPQKSMAWWMAVIGAILGGLGLAFTYETAVIIANAPWLGGLIIAFIAFVGYLGFNDHETELAEFNKRNIEDTTNIHGEEAKEARGGDKRLRTIIRRNGKIFMPAGGIRPAIARYWAQPAEVDESELEVVNETTGDVSKEYEIDPDADQTLLHTPAHLKFSPALMSEPESEEVLFKERLEQLEDFHPYVAAVGALPFTTVNAAASFVRALNVRYLAIAVGGGAGLYFGLSALGASTLAIGAALLPGTIAGFEARDGELEIEPAPYHFQPADVILAVEREVYTEADTFQRLHDLVMERDLNQVEEVQEMVEAIRNKMTERTRDFYLPEEADDSQRTEATGDD